MYYSRLFGTTEDMLNSLNNVNYELTKADAINRENKGMPKDQAWVFALRKTIIENIKERLRSKRYSEEQINTEVLEFFKCASDYYSYDSHEYNHYKNRIENVKNFIIVTLTRKFKEEGYSSANIQDLTNYYLKEIFSDTNTNTDTYSYTHSTDFDWANVIVPEPVNNQQPKSFFIPVSKDVKIVSRVQRGEAGLSFEEDQKLNFTEAEYDQKLHYKCDENRETERHTKASNEEAERHAERMREINSDLSGRQANIINSFLNPNATGNSSIHENDGNLDYCKFARLFIEEMSLVKEGFTKRYR